MWSLVYTVFPFYAVITRSTAKINEQKNKLAHSPIDYKDARILKENSDEKRLQPIYIRLFFEKAFKNLGGAITASGIVSI